MSSLLLIGLLAGCGVHWVPHCEQAVEALGWEEDSALGFSPQDALLAVGLEHEAVAVHEDGGETTPVRLTMTGAGTGAYVDSWEAEPPDNVWTSADIGVTCYDSVQSEVDVVLTTDDGALDEVLSLTLDSVAEGEATIYATLRRSDIRGSVDLSALDDPRYDSAHVSLALDFRDGGWTGELSVEGQGATDDATFAESVRLLSW